MQNMTINRRSALKHFSFLAGSTLSASALMSVFNLSHAATWQPLFLSAPQREWLAELAEHIIPSTDTPGAKAAQVERFIEQMLWDCYAEKDRQQFVQSLDDFSQACEQQLGRAFMDSTKEQQIQCLQQVQDQDFFPVLKELTVQGYFTSEIGATQALSYVPIPGDYLACIPYSNTKAAAITEGHP